MEGKREGGKEGWVIPAKESGSGAHELRGRPVRVR